MNFKNLKKIFCVFSLFTLAYFSCIHTSTVYANTSIPTYDIVIAGSGPAGLSAAIYAARSKLKILVVEGPNPLGSLAAAKKVDNFPGFPGGISGEELMVRMQEQAESFNPDFNSNLVSKIIAGTDQNNFLHLVELSDKTSVYAKAIIIATGMSQHLLGLPQEQELIGNGVFVCAECDAPLFEDKVIMVAGGGKHALDEATHVLDFAKKVYIVHEGEKLTAKKSLISNIMKNPKVEILFNTKIVKLNSHTIGSGLSTEKVLKSVDLKSIYEEDDTNLKNYKIDGLLVATGKVRANTSFVPKEMKQVKDGFILTQNDVETNITGIFAAGNVQDLEYRQAVVAAGSGAQAAMRAVKYVKTKEE